MKNCKANVRIKSYAIDLAIFVVSVAVLAPAFLAIAYFVFEAFDAVSKFEELHIDNLLAFIFLYLMLLTKDFVTENGSIGNKIIKIKIVAADGTSKPSKKQLFIRGVIACLLPIEIMLCFFNIDRLSLSDIVSKTKVVYESQESQNKFE